MKDGSKLGRWLPLCLLPASVLWIALFASRAWLSVLRYCAEHYDFGIYVQAIARFSLREFNPWLSARGVHVFNDHFDPILLVAAVFRVFAPAHIAGLLTEHLFVLGALVPVLWLWRRGDLGGLEATTLGAVLLFSVGTIDAVLFPIHPTTWTILPAVLIGAA